MSKTMGWKIILILGVIGFSVVMFLPLDEKINLGLDLKGGMHLVFRVETNDAIRKRTDNDVLRLKNLLKENSIKYEKVVRQGRDKIDVIGSAAEERDAIKDLLEDYFREWDYLFSGNGVALSLRPNIEMNWKGQSVIQALETIRNRVDEFGVAEPVFQREGENRLLIELPGVSDKEKSRVMGLIESTALLEFKKVIKEGPYPTKEDALAEYGGVLPEDLELVKWGPKGRIKGFSILQAATVITGSDMKNASRSADGYGAPQIAFSLNSNGASKFKSFTAANVGQKLAIVLDNKILTDPVIQDVLSYDSVITGRFTVEEADDLSLKLRSGALPAELTLLHEQTIGPSLGADSIRKGVYACLIGLLCVMLFMVVYYKAAGINSIVALILNLVILLGVLAYFRATLTLPGIAGIILTIGMSVDANVLIFERIKEDLRAGKAPKSAIDSGFKKAFVTIVDANLTTIIAAIFLFQFGTSTIKGFSVTLMIGIVASMFTAVFVSRVIFDLVYSTRKKLTKISI
jgi:preprotein translocase subunit SecD